MVNDESPTTNPTLTSQPDQIREITMTYKQQILEAMKLALTYIESGYMNSDAINVANKLHLAIERMEQ